MSKITMRRMTAILLTLMSLACNAEEKCNIKYPDANGYLQEICNYIVSNNIDVNPGKPNEYKITSITSTMHNGSKAILVNLNCCYLGDAATINPETKKVLKFRVGPK